METVIASGAGRRKARAERVRVRTTPPGLWLAGIGPVSNETPIPAADLIALARAARRTAADDQSAEPDDTRQGDLCEPALRSVPTA